MPKRPYFRLPIHELEGLAARSCNDPHVLVELAAELRHRDTRRAQHLRSVVDAYLQAFPVQAPGSSGYPACRYCSKPISLRRMPAGHWLAFEPGWRSQVHQCRAATTSAPAAALTGAAADPVPGAAAPVPGDRGWRTALAWMIAASVLYLLLFGK